MTEDKLVYLAYAVFNLMDGSDFHPIGVFPTLEGALEALKEYMIDNEDEDLTHELTSGGTTFYTEDDDRSYNITPITIYK